MSNEVCVFILTQVHINLVMRLNVGLCDDSGYSSPAIDRKRPYGNSDVLSDISNILGEDHSDDDDFTRDDEERLECISVDVSTALEIILQTGSFKVGTYRKIGLVGDKSNWELDD